MASDLLNVLTLKGSTEVICDMLTSCVHNILYLRSVFHPSMFKTKEAYDMQVFVCTDEKMNKYVEEYVQSLRYWLMKKEAHRLVLVLVDGITDERLERWQFDIQLDDESISCDSSKPVDVKKLRKQLRQLMLQIHNINLLLPTLPDWTPCFKMLIYTKDTVETPAEFLETTQHFIPDGQMVNFDNVETGIHTVKSRVQYKLQDNTIEQSTLH